MNFIMYAEFGKTRTTVAAELLNTLVSYSIATVIMFLQLLLLGATSVATALDLASLRGANYILSAGRSGTPGAADAPSWDFLAPASKWNATTVARELGWASQRLRLNAIRIRASPGECADDPTAFAADWRTLRSLCADLLNVTILPVLFDPGDLQYEKTTEQYLKTVVADARDDPAVMGFDLCNECFVLDATAQKALAGMAQAVHELKGAQQFTTAGVGDLGLWPHEDKQLELVDVFSFHSYDGNRSDMGAHIEGLKKRAEGKGKTVGFASEIMNRPWDALCGDLQVLKQQQLGWIFWELMVSSSGWGVPKCGGCPPGLLWPNGSAFDEEEVSCILGDGRFLWLPLPLNAAFSGNGSSVALAPAGAWSVVHGGTDFLPWKNLPLLGQGGVRTADSAAATVATLTLRFDDAFCGVALVYTAANGTSAKLTVSVDGAALAGFDAVAGAVARRAWLAQNLRSAAGGGGQHVMVLTAASGEGLVFSGFDLERGCGAFRALPKTDDAAAACTCDGFCRGACQPLSSPSLPPGLPPYAKRPRMNATLYRFTPRACSRCWRTPTRVTPTATSASSSRGLRWARAAPPSRRTCAASLRRGRTSRSRGGQSRWTLVLARTWRATRRT